jgi:hypothetical protein
LKSENSTGRTKHEPLQQTRKRLTNIPPPPRPITKPTAPAPPRKRNGFHNNELNDKLRCITEPTTSNARFPLEPTSSQQNQNMTSPFPQKVNRGKTTCSPQGAKREAASRTTYEKERNEEKESGKSTAPVEAFDRDRLADTLRLHCESSDTKIACLSICHFLLSSGFFCRYGQKGNTYKWEKATDVSL